MRRFIILTGLLAMLVMPAQANRWPSSSGGGQKQCWTFRFQNSTHANDGQCAATQSINTAGVSCTGLSNFIVAPAGISGTNMRFTDMTCTLVSVASTAGSVDLRPATMNASNTFAATTIGLNVTSADQGTTKATTFTSSNTVSGGPFAVQLVLDYSVGAAFTDLDGWCAVCGIITP